MNKNSKQKLIAFIYKGGRRKRLLNKCSKYPSEFFYGYIELLEQGYNVSMFEEIELGFRLKNKFINSVLILLSKMLFDLPLNMFLGFVLSGGFNKLRRYQTIVATTNAVVFV